MAFTRIDPIFPSGLLNYFFGLTNVSYKKYAWSTFFFILPIFLFSYMGDLAGGIVLSGESQHLIKNISLISLIAVLLSVGFVFFKKYWQNKNL